MSIQCSICFDDIENDINKVITLCNHTYHSTCLIKNIVINGSNCPNCRKNLTGEENKNYYEEEEYDYENDPDIEEDDDGEENNNEDFDIDVFLSDEDRILQNILMEQVDINSQNDQTIINNFKNKNYEGFENLLKTTNYKYFKGNYKYNSYLDNKVDFMVNNSVTTFIEKYRDSNNFIYCLRAYKSDENKYNIYGIFILKNNDLGLIDEDFNAKETTLDTILSKIRPQENKNTLISEKYNIFRY